MKQREEFIEQMKEALLSRRAELTELLKRNTEEDVEGIGEVKDSADEAYSSTMHKLQSSIEENEIEELHLIEDALARIDRGEYGVCINCEEPINTKRLEIFPYAARCIACQEMLEG